MTDLILKYLDDNFYVKHKIDYPLINETTKAKIFRKENNKEIHGQLVYEEIYKIFSLFDLDYNKGILEYWLRDNGIHRDEIKELTEKRIYKISIDPIINDPIIVREYMQTIKEAFMRRPNNIEWVHNADINLPTFDV